MLELWSRFHFLRPELLWLLVPFVLGGLSCLVQARAASPWRRVIRAELLARLETKQPLARRFGPELLVMGLGCLAVFCAAGPCYRAQWRGGDPAQSPLIVVFELSQTMAKTDVKPSRAERARLELIDLLRARPTSPTALVVVAGSSHVLLPFTDDVAALEPYVGALSPELMPSDGQDFVGAARLVEGLVDESPAFPALLIVSDGLPSAGAQALGALARRRGLGTVALVLGAADAEQGELERLVDASVALSYSGRDVPRLLSDLATSRGRHVPPRDQGFWQDEGPVWAWPLAVGLALWFRPGFALRRRARGLLVALAVVGLQGCSPWLEGIWLTPDQQGRLAFERGDYLSAAQRFEDPVWKGLSFYAAEKWDEAAAQFVGRDDADSLFYLGNAYAEGGKLQSAVHAYDEALRSRPTFRQARANRDRIEELLRSLQEDTDHGDMKVADPGSDDAATRLSQDTVVVKPHSDTPDTKPAESSRAGEVEQGVWLEHLSTEPTEFLKRKLAAQAARSATAPVDAAPVDAAPPGRAP
ncbi:MAG TPA: VWA domain-containing protein [Polyangiaceae bacterium]|nr:VWA domain-containing protein [Polyangiaceae bacterium]